MVFPLKANEHYSLNMQKTCSVVGYDVLRVFNTMIKSNQYFYNSSQNTKCESTLIVLKKENQYDAEITFFIKVLS